MAPKQPEMGLITYGKIVLSSGNNFEQALADLKGFDRIWVIFWFDRNKGWTPKVNTPRSGPKRGLFSTRSPHRPNPIGLSCVELLDVKGLELMIGKNDLLDGTPILDIKPYLVYADSFPDSHQGWIENVPDLEYRVEWTPRSKAQADFIERNAQISLNHTVELRLKYNPFPFPNHRIKQIKVNEYELSFKTWRIVYSVNEDLVLIDHIHSGYDKETLQGKKISKWGDVDLHLEFNAYFYP